MRKTLLSLVAIFAMALSASADDLTINAADFNEAKGKEISATKDGFTLTLTAGGNTEFDATPKFIYHDYHWSSTNDGEGSVTYTITAPEGATVTGLTLNDEDGATADLAAGAGPWTLTISNYYLPFFAETETEMVSLTIHYQTAGDANAISTVNAAAQTANKKFMENGKVVIIKNGLKYNVAGQLIK